MSLHINENDDGQFQRLVCDWSIARINVLYKRDDVTIGSESCKRVMQYRIWVELSQSPPESKTPALKLPTRYFNEKILKMTWWDVLL